MGMFDYVSVQMELPDGYKTIAFQTKDFDCLMEEYRITSEGKLELFDRSEEQWYEWHNRKGDTFHGIFTFYDYSEDDVWHEYDAKFTDGKLIEIQGGESGFDIE